MSDDLGVRPTPDLRIEALRLAHSSSVTPERVIARAAAYLAWLEGGGEEAAVIAPQPFDGRPDCAGCGNPFTPDARGQDRCRRCQRDAA